MYIPLPVASSSASATRPFESTTDTLPHGQAKKATAATTTTTMILSRPPNPPYRVPNRTTSPPSQTPPSSQSSSLGPSPKRKREPPPSTPEPQFPQYIHHDLQHSPEAGNHSPRSRVAERFQTLDLHHRAATHHQTPSPSTPTSDSTNDVKRTKLDDEMIIAETPPQPPPPPPPPQPQNKPRHRYRSPSPFPTRNHPPATRNGDGGEGGDGIRVLLPESVDRQAMTWQPAEITGATIDGACGDDDGEGMNGIGFRPTAAMAEKRAARRRVQVSEWKAREAREARVKRMVERKKRRGEDDGRGGGGEGEGEGDGMGRRVRFQDGR